MKKQPYGTVITQLLITLFCHQNATAITIEEYMPKDSTSPSSTNSRYGVQNKNAYMRGYKVEKTKDEPALRKNDDIQKNTEGYQYSNPTNEPSSKEYYNSESSSQYSPNIQTHASQ